LPKSDNVPPAQEAGVLPDEKPCDAIGPSGLSNIGLIEYVDVFRAQLQFQPLGQVKAPPHAKSTWPIP
jgi:hypothetical protein